MTLKKKTVELFGYLRGVFRVDAGRFFVAEGRAGWGGGENQISIF